ncbi:MAG: xanthine dehydrogenase family protein molybdopterin-binding subunit [Actinomycetota bacterium]|nr:xanthine dehydrogenase family protein molybdopterin-binding subunit [Actinomycetota bacterium]
MSIIGRRIRRLEDRRLLRGLGHFVDDVNRVGQLWMRVLRSPYAHARILDVRADKALALHGVEIVLAGEELAWARPIPVRTRTEHQLDDFLQPILARDRVRYVGEPIAVVLAEDPYLAEDATELVEVEYEELSVALEAREVIEEDAPQLREEAGNEAATLSMGYGDVEEAFQNAARVVETEVKVGRHSGVPIETRGLVAEYDAGSDHLTIWGATKVPHFNRRVLSQMLGMPLSRISMKKSDAGGGFGVRGEFYPEDFLVPYLARETRRPVKWIEDRQEHLVATNHSREQVRRLEAAFDDQHNLLGLRDEVWQDTGAYIRTHGVIVADLTLAMLPGPYRVPAYEGTAHVALTNKTPCGTVRGPGRFEATFAREHLLDVAAAELGVDRLELRRINLLDSSEMPHTRPLSTLGTNVVLDAGDYKGLLEKALAHSGFEDWEEEAQELRNQGRLIGTGIGYFLEKSGLGPYEEATVEVDPTGAVRVLTGGTSLGQGIETVLAQIAADQLGVPPEEIEVVHTDTELLPDGVGSWASRSTVVGGSAVMLAAKATAEKALRVAAEMLEASTEDLRLKSSEVRVAGSPDKSVSLGEIAAACEPHSGVAREEAPGLGTRRTFSVDHMTYPYGVHLAQVEVDPETGGVEILRYFVAYEVGRAVNPTLVEGQLVGGAAQGLGGALLEEFRYDDAGQPLAATFIDYMEPTASEVPRRVETLICEDAPSPDNPLGLKGAGEGGAVGCGAAVAGAVEDALRMPDSISTLPVTPSRIRTLVRRTNEADSPPPTTVSPSS